MTFFVITTESPRKPYEIAHNTFKVSSTNTSEADIVFITNVVDELRCTVTFLMGFCDQIQINAILLGIYFAIDNPVHKK